MTLLKYTLLLLAVLLSVAAAATTIQELALLSRQNVAPEEFSPLALAFIESTDDLDELNYAGYLWANADSTGYFNYLANRLAAYPENPKYAYLQIGTQPDPQSRILASREIIRAFPQYPGGYLALFFNHLSSIAAATQAKTPDLVAESMLREDLHHIEAFGRLFPEQKYARMTRVFYHLMQDDMEAVKAPFREALDSEDSWLVDFDLSRIVPMSKYHRLLRYHIDLLREKDSDQQVKYDLAQKAGDLSSYYYDEAQDYGTVIAYFGPDPLYWENQYVVYCLAMSYYQTGDLASIYPLLTYNGNSLAAEAFQDAWLSFDPVQSKAVYSAVLQDRQKDLLASYLYARAALDDTGKLTRGKSLAKSSPKENYGYRLINDYYLNFFGAAKLEDPKRSAMAAALKKDKKYFQKHLELFPESMNARVGFLLSSLANKKDAEALEVFKKLLGTEIPADIYPLIYKLMSDFDRIDLLLKANEAAAQSKVDIDYETTEEAHNYAVVSFCQTLNDNGRYSRMLEMVDKNPAWLKNKDLQFLLVNSHYFQNDYTKAIAMLRYMVEQGTVGSTMLRTMAGDPMAQHADWQALVDYASTMPDPDAGADQEELDEDEEPAEMMEE